MYNTSQANQSVPTATVITPQQLLDHWQGHRRLTRRLIESFPKNHLFSYAVGGMRPFSELVFELIAMAGPGIRGVVTGEWDSVGNQSDADQTPVATTQQQVLALWDEVTEQIDTLWPKIEGTRFQEVDIAFGQYEGTIFWFIFYLIDNEIHHRGQAYVYLRTLGIEPPHFWDRS